MNNQEYITRNAALTVANTQVLYHTVLSMDILDANQVRKLVEEVIVQIEDDASEKFTNFNEAVRLATPAVILEAHELREAAKS